MAHYGALDGLYALCVDTKRIYPHCASVAACKTNKELLTQICSCLTTIGKDHWCRLVSLWLPQCGTVVSVHNTVTVTIDNAFMK